eukprot:evm.model.scf_1932.1 EVM.evm.TU.scf_1932.1   scf_1932:9848-13867(-)
MARGVARGWACLLLSWGLLTGLALSSASADFSYFYLVREWNPSFCLREECVRRPRNSFTLHGLWPQQRDGKYPTYCGNKAEHYDPKDLVDLKPRLDVEWPSLITDGDSFWRHEWEKHGTCANMTEHGYFEEALALHEKYSILGALESADIVPSNTTHYRGATVSQALKAGLGVNVLLRCSSGCLSEVWMCVSKTWKPFDCWDDDLNDLTSSCHTMRIPLVPSQPPSTDASQLGAYLRMRILAVPALLLVVVVAILVLKSFRDRKRRNTLARSAATSPLLEEK